MKTGGFPGLACGAESGEIVSISLSRAETGNGFRKEPAAGFRRSGISFLQVGEDVNNSKIEEERARV
jgi:hypothetical protein